MPLGWERLNAKSSRPNENIVFIKPLPGAEESISKEFLERIAAQSLPIMNKHHLAVVSLEEYEPNLEFWGTSQFQQWRGNPACRSLSSTTVLRSPSTNRWLPFKFVQMVFMHELAHIKQMNHSKLFWAVRNEFSAEMKVLWENGYTGDGLWGRGLLLENGKFSHEELGEDEVMPDHMCGGGFKSRGRKRKIKPKVTYKERQERRIKKRFGTNGITLGADGKANLEKGKRPPGKPRVAGSARGRELRAAAALSRFETKKEPEHKEEDLMTDSESASDLHHDDDDDALVKTEFPDAVDINGDKLLDSNGQSYVKVCDDEDRNDEDVREELLDLLGISGSSVSRQADLKRAIEPELESQKTKNSKSAATNHSQTSSESNAAARQGLEELKPAREKRMFTNSTEREVDGAASERSCPVCSMLNEATSLTCNVCSNVLQPDFVPNSWRCGSLVCKDSAFVNAGDVVLCGVCRTRK